VLVLEEAELVLDLDSMSLVTGGQPVEQAEQLQADKALPMVKMQNAEIMILVEMVETLMFQTLILQKTLILKMVTMGVKKQVKR
jgi:hypothetical protein